MSRLDYAPKLKEIKVTDIKKGIGVFTPKPDKLVSFAALKETLKKAGYTLAAADITATGKLIKEGEAWFLVVGTPGQRFALDGSNANELLKGITDGGSTEVKGDWKTVGDGTDSREVITVASVKRASPKLGLFRNSNASQRARFMLTAFDVSEPDLRLANVTMRLAGNPAAPIRVTSPGLTVYKGGAVTPRVYFIKQHLGDLDVTRQVLDVSISYTPSPRVQLEVEVPISRTSFDDNVTSGSEAGLGNITLWSKYRFFRKVKTYGDRQAAVRFGLELPTGKTDAPTLAQLNAPAFVRQQLTPISGGLSPHFDVAFSQAGGRIIFGGNAEAIVRSEREGFRMGHEIRLNSDTEYVLLPRKYDAPGGELFVILETTFIHRSTGRAADLAVAGSKSTEYYLAPGLQYAAAPQFVIEGSVQFPVIRNAGPMVLRTDHNFLLGVRYLF